MTFRVVADTELETPGGTVSLSQGQVIRLSKDEAISLIEAGIIAEICYWQDKVIQDCQKPCYRAGRGGNIVECKHFRDYWNSRLAEINLKMVIPGP